jgi:hypothetical protein
MNIQNLVAWSSPRRLMILCSAGIFALGIGIAAYYFLPNPVDWTLFYRPAALALVSGSSPYTIGSFFNAPWILLPLIPFALLPYRVGVAAWFVANLAIFLYICWRMAARPIAGAAFMCSLPVIVSLLFGQVDGLVLLGLFLPRYLGLMLLLAKPQIGIVVALFLLVEIWRESGWKQVIKTFAPVTVLFLISFALFGLWPLAYNPASLISTDHNTSLWPGSLMIGLPLIVYAFRTRRENFAWMSAPFFSPYVAPQSWSVALLGLMHNDVEMIAASLATWAMFIYRVIH